MGDIDRMAEAIRRAMPGATVTITPESISAACPDCNGEGVIETLLFDGRPVADPCGRCGGMGWAGAPTDVDDADHAEYVDPIDHTHDAPISAVALQQRLQAVLDIHRSTEDHTCSVEPHALYPCPTARAALGIVQ